MRRRFTLFHVLWLVGALCCAYVAYTTSIGAPIGARIAVTAMGFVFGLIFCSVAVTLLVTFIVIPRLKPGSYWQYEVDSFMRTVFGKRWP